MESNGGNSNRGRKRKTSNVPRRGKAGFAKKRSANDKTHGDKKVNPAKKAHPFKIKKVSRKPRNSGDPCGL
jgi:hypothetical protein